MVSQCRKKLEDRGKKKGKRGHYIPLIDGPRGMLQSLPAEKKKECWVSEGKKWFGVGHRPLMFVGKKMIGEKKENLHKGSFIADNLLVYTRSKAAHLGRNCLM